MASLAERSLEPPIRLPGVGVLSARSRPNQAVLCRISLTKYSSNKQGPERQKGR